MFIFLFHGSEVLGFVAGIGIGLVGLPGVLIWLWNRPPRMPFLPAISFLAVGITTYIAFFFAELGFFFLLSAVFSSPWSLLFILASLADVGESFAEYLLPGGIALNAAIIYVIGKWARLLEDHPNL